MSRVFLAVVRGPGDFNKLQVIKRLLPTLAADPEFLQMFLEEARLSARLNHANIVQINEVGFDGAHHFMAMEYLEGQPLESIVRRATNNDDGRFTTAMHLRIISDACIGLHYAHELADIDGKPLNIVHRDVSPHNVFVTYAGQVKVLDFGIAKAADSSHHTRTGVLKGKCSYMAPEQFRAEGVDRRADIFALGVMVWQAITRRRLWKGLSDVEIFHRLAHGEIPSPLSVDPYLPSPLVHICERALAPNPLNRYGSAAELGEALDNYLSTLPDAADTRHIGRNVSELFADSRAKVKAAIEAELQKSQTISQNTADIPIFVDPNVPSSAENSGENHASSKDLDVSHTETPPFAKKRGSSGIKVAAVLGVAAVVGAAAVAWRGMPARNVASNTPPATALHSEQAPAHEADTAERPGGDKAFTVLKARAVPESATLYVDEVQLSSNPASGRFVRDGLTHRVRAEAPGYKDRVELVVYDGADAEVVLKLERDPTVPATPPRFAGRVVSNRPAGTPSGVEPPPPSVTSPPPSTQAPAASHSSNKPALDRDPWHN